MQRAPMMKKMFSPPLYRGYCCNCCSKSCNQKNCVLLVLVADRQVRPAKSPGKVEEAGAAGERRNRRRRPRRSGALSWEPESRRHWQQKHYHRCGSRCFLGSSSSSSDDDEVRFLHWFSPCWALFFTPLEGERSIDSKKKDVSSLGNRNVLLYVG